MALLIGLALADGAQGYELARAADGQPLDGAWLPVRLSVTLDDALIAPADRGLLSARAAAWHAALQWAAPSESAVHFWRQDPGHSEPDPPTSELSLQALQDHWPSEYGSVLATVAFTVVEQDPGARRIRAAEVLVNAVGFEFSTSDSPRRLDLEGTLSHEIGHALGLEHPCGESFGAYPDCSALPSELAEAIEEASLYPTASSGNIWQRDPAADDLAGLQALYGEGRGPAPRLEIDCVCEAGQARWQIFTGARIDLLEIYPGAEPRALPAPATSCPVAGQLCDRGTLPAPAQPVDVEVRDPDSGKRAVVFDMVCEPCPQEDAGPSDGAGVDDGTVAPGAPLPGCQCGGSDPRSAGLLWVLVLGAARGRRAWQGC